MNAPALSLRRKLATARTLSPGQLAMVAEATLALGMARLVILTLPFRRYARWLSKPDQRDPAPETALRQVRWAVELAARNVPWNAVCLPQALAAKALLYRRGYSSTLHLGVQQANSELKAHAWLEANGVIVVGIRGMPGMTRMASFD